MKKKYENAIRDFRTDLFHQYEQTPKYTKTKEVGERLIEQSPSKVKKELRVILNRFLSTHFPHCHNH